MIISTLGAGAGEFFTIATVVAHQPGVGPVIGQGNAAMGAFPHAATAGAPYAGMIAPAVEQQNRLLAPLESLFQGVEDSGAVNRSIALHRLPPHVHNIGIGKLCRRVSLAEGHQMVSPHLGKVIALHRRGGGTQ